MFCEYTRNIPVMLTPGTLTTQTKWYIPLVRVHSTSGQNCQKKHSEGVRFC